MLYTTNYVKELERKIKEINKLIAKYEKKASSKRGIDPDYAQAFADAVVAVLDA